MAYQVLWDVEHACGVLPELYATEEEAENAGNRWREDMCAVDGDDPNSDDCPYEFEVVEAETPPDPEEVEAVEEQSLDYFNHYIAGDR